MGDMLTFLGADGRNCGGRAKRDGKGKREEARGGWAAAV
jgi:hypothetical protein